MKEGENQPAAQQRGVFASQRSVLALSLALLLMGAVVLVNFLSFSKVGGVMESQLLDRQQIAADYAASRIEEHIHQVSMEVTTLSSFPALKNLDLSQCSGDVKIIHPSLEGKTKVLLRVDALGNIVECSSPNYKGYVGLNVRNKDYFKVPAETGASYVSGLARDGSDYNVFVSAPIFEGGSGGTYPNNGEFGGILLSIVGLQDLYDLYIHPIGPMGRDLFVLASVDAGDTVMKSQGAPDLGGLGKVHEIRDYAGTGRTIAVSSDLSLGSEKFRLFILTPLANADKEIRDVRAGYLFSLFLAVSAILGALLLAASAYLSRERIRTQLARTTETLESLGITVETERSGYSPTDIVLEPHKVYLLKEDGETSPHDLFIGMLSHGFAGLGIVRDDPRELRKKYSLKKTSFIWLSEAGGGRGVPAETKIETLLGLAREFVERSEKSVILIDRLDYLIFENGFERVLKAVYALRDLVARRKCVVIISANPAVIPKEQMEAFSAETIDLFGGRAGAGLSKDEAELLSFVNEGNVASRLVSYTDVTEQLGITKPTARAKIRRLQDAGFLSVEKVGRVKAVRITSLGRKIIS